tara:strand:+ start:552 stop:662 length:111 start_codon:yes stop_codon:yes gene_type:complete
MPNNDQEAEKIRFAAQDMRNLWNAVRLAQEMGKSLG